MIILRPIQVTVYYISFFNCIISATIGDYIVFFNGFLFGDEEIIELSEMTGMNIVTYDDITGDEIELEFSIEFQELFEKKKEDK